MTTRPSHRRVRRRLAHLALSGFVAAAACFIGTSSVSAAGWARITGVNPGTTANDLLAVSSMSATDIWTVGWQQGSLNPQTLAEHSTNGTSWAVVTTQNATTNDNELAGVAAISASDVWAVGWSTNAGFFKQPYIQHWTGGVSFAPVATATLGATTDQQFKAVYANSASDIWAVGQTTAGAYIQHWNGIAWSIVTSAAADTLAGVSGTGSSDVWAVGTKTQNPFAEHWNGTTWSVPTTPPVPGSTTLSDFYAVTAITASDVWAVGFGFGTASRTLTEHWTGAAWVLVASANSGTVSNNNSLFGVSASSASDVWAVGTVTPGSFDQPLAEHWNGSSWALSVPVTPCTTQNVEIYAVEEITAANVWASGATSCPSGTSQVTAIFQYTSVVTCTGGSLTLTSPVTAAFGTVTLNGSDQTTTGNLAFTASDMTGSGAGWAISGTSTQFFSGGNTLPTTASAVTASSAADPGGNCALPVNTIGTPSNLPAGAGPPTAAKLYNSTATNGKGPTTVTLTFRLSIPASAHIGTYASTWTFTIASGP